MILLPSKILSRGQKFQNFSGTNTDVIAPAVGQDKKITDVVVGRP